MQVRGLITFGLNGEYVASAGPTDDLIFQAIMNPEFFPGPGSTYTCLVSWRQASNTTATARIYYGGTLQNVHLVPVVDGVLQASNSLVVTTAPTNVSITISNVPKPTSQTLWKLSMSNAALRGVRVTLK